MTTITYTVPNISCSHCIHTITTELKQLSGVARVEASLDNKRVTIEFEAPASDSAIQARLTEINYPVAV